MPCSMHVCVDESSRKFLEEAMKKGFVVVRLVKVIVVGPAGVGKTCLILLLLGKPPPDKRHSTGCAERSIRVIHIGKEGEEWSEVSNEDFQKIIAEAVPILCEDLKKKGKDISVVAEVLSTLHHEEETTGEAESTGGKDVMGGKSGTGDMSSETTENKPSTSQAAQRKTVIESVIQDLTKLVSSSDTSRRLMEMELIYLTDCGGQQAYWDLVPIFVRDTSATLFVHRLCEKLDEHPLNDLYQSEERVGPEQRARLTTAQAFKTMLQGLGDKGKRSKIITVGTHKDLASKCEESPSQKNKRFVEIASSHFSTDIVYQSESMNEVIFQVNTEKPGDDGKIKAKEIRSSIEKAATEVKIPIWWFILQQILEALAHKLDRDVLKKEECVHISETLGFSDGELDVALDFFDKLNIFVYKKNILPNVVFTNAQVPLDKLSELVEKQYQLKAAAADPSKAETKAMSGEWKLFRDNAILVPSLLKEFNRHYVPGVFSANEFLVLLKELLIVSKLSVSSDEYFFPAILDMNENIRACLTNSSQVSPLVVWFSTGWAPPGVFCCSVCHLQSHAGWEIKKPTKYNSKDAPLNVSRNAITLSKPGTPGSMTFIDNFSFFAINVDTKKLHGEDLVKHCEMIKKEVFAAVTAGLEKTHHTNSRPKPAFICPVHKNEACDTELHVAHISISETHKRWICSENTDEFDSLTPDQTVWLGGPGKCL